MISLKSDLILDNISNFIQFSSLPPLFESLFPFLFGNRTKISIEDEIKLEKIKDPEKLKFIEDENKILKETI